MIVPWRVFDVTCILDVDIDIHQRPPLIGTRKLVDENIYMFIDCFANIPELAWE